MISKLFISKEKRDQMYKELKAEGLNVYKTTHRGQQLHPMYIEDYPRELSTEEKGVGNTLYQTVFPVLYVIEER